MGGQPLNKPIVGMAFDTRTGGYYEVASDGGIFAFNAPFYGSMGGKPLNEPIVGMAFDPATGGYYEVASDGGIFAFNAPFQGSMGGKPLNKPMVGMAFDTSTGGLLPGGIGRRGLRLRRSLPGLHGRQALQRALRRLRRSTTPRAAISKRPPTAGSSPSAPPSRAPWAATR